MAKRIWDQKQYFLQTHEHFTQLKCNCPRRAGEGARLGPGAATSALARRAGLGRVLADRAPLIVGRVNTHPPAPHERKE